MTVFAMPSLGADMVEGKLVEWLVKPGDTVARGDVVAVVETQKGAIEIEIFEAGEIVELLVEPGHTLPVGAPLARLRAAGQPEAQEKVNLPTEPDALREPETGAEANAPVPSPNPAAEPAPFVPAIGAGAALASPAARAAAAEAGLALDRITGSGPAGAVLFADVARHAKERPTESAERAGESPANARPRLDMAEMRRAIAAAVSRSKREIPHFYLSHEIDLQTAQDWLTARNSDRTPDKRVLMGAVLIRATIKALAKVTELNGRFEAPEYAAATAVHCGVAVAMRGGGLIAPAILDAQDKDLDAVMDGIRDIVARTRAGRLRNSEVTQGTITVSSLGETGVDALFGVIYPPQVALVGFGAPRMRPMVRDGTVRPRLAVTVTLAADHRVSDGRRGALFLAEIDRLLQEPRNT